MKKYFCGVHGDNIMFEIVDHIGVLSTEQNGWRKELNVVKWNGGESKYDIRSWDEDHERMTRGITLTPKEFSRLQDMLGIELLAGGIRKEQEQ